MRAPLLVESDAFVRAGEGGTKVPEELDGGSTSEASSTIKFDEGCDTAISE